MLVKDHLVEAAGAFLDDYGGEEDEGLEDRDLENDEGEPESKV